jgi:hypothetical protein
LSDERLKTGAEVVFRLGDAICPDFEQIANQLGPDLAVNGEVVLLSDSGSHKMKFAVIDVRGICTPLIVPVRMLNADEFARNTEASVRFTEG